MQGVGGVLQAPGGERVGAGRNEVGDGEYEPLLRLDPGVQRPEQAGVGAAMRLDGREPGGLPAQRPVGLAGGAPRLVGRRPAGRRRERDEPDELLPDGRRAGARPARRRCPRRAGGGGGLSGRQGADGRGRRAVRTATDRNAPSTATKPTPPARVSKSRIHNPALAATVPPFTGSARRARAIMRSRRRAARWCAACASATAPAEERASRVRRLARRRSSSALPPATS